MIDGGMLSFLHLSTLEEAEGLGGNPLKTFSMASFAERHCIGWAPLDEGVDWVAFVAGVVGDGRLLLH